MIGPLEALEPRLLWKHFAGLCSVPRPSRHEEAVSSHVRAWAESKGYEVARDAAGNLVIRVPAAEGMANAPTVVLQAHLDMVGEKNEGVRHDFHRDPISPRLDGEWVRAEGTTLGADNGIGVAAAMAVAEELDLQRGPLELLFTLDEETGLNGARELDPSLVTGRLLLNLDSEEDGAIYIGCAGAGGIEGSLDLERDERPDRTWSPFELRVRGLSGGHSGLDIVRNPGNALKIMAGLLGRAQNRGLEFALASLDGGDKGNAIPRESRAFLYLREEGTGPWFRWLGDLTRELALEFGEVAPGLALELSPAEETKEHPRPLAADCGDRLIRFLQAFPDGVWAMSRVVPGLVETSSNLANLRTEAERLSFLCSCRSSVDSALSSQLQSLLALCRLSGVEAVARGAYPGWPPRPNSPLVRRTAAVHQAVLGTAPELKAVHAGLECGLLVQKLSGLDAVSIGPEIRGAHSPDERVWVPSVGRFYRLLGALLEDLAAADPT